MKVYTTKHGDTWDHIAFQQYGSEYMLPVLIEANPKVRETVIFSSGIEITIPSITTESDTSYIPEWLTGKDEGNSQKEESGNFLWPLEEE